MADTSSNSTIIYQTKLHWIIFMGPVSILFLGIMLGIYLPIFYLPALLLLVFGTFWFIMSAVTYQVSSVIVQKRHILLTTGLLVRQTFNMPLQKIESIDIRQPILGSILHYGTLIVTGTGGTKHSITYLQHPLTCRRHIEMLLNH